MPEPTRPYTTPLVRKVAASLGVDLTTVQGTGAGGRIRTDDVRAAAANLGLQTVDLPEPSTTNAQPVRQVAPQNAAQMADALGPRPGGDHWFAGIAHPDQSVARAQREWDARVYGAMTHEEYEEGLARQMAVSSPGMTYAQALDRVRNGDPLTAASQAVELDIWELSR